MGWLVWEASVRSIKSASCCGCSVRNNPLVSCCWATCCKRTHCHHAGTMVYTGWQWRVCACVCVCAQVVLRCT